MLQQTFCTQQKAILKQKNALLNLISLSYSADVWIYMSFKDFFKTEDNAEVFKKQMIIKSKAIKQNNNLKIYCNSTGTCRRAQYSIHFFKIMDPSYKYYA